MKTWQLFFFKFFLLIFVIPFFLISCGENSFFSRSAPGTGSKVTADFTPTLMGGKVYRFVNTTSFYGIGENLLTYTWSFGDGTDSVVKTDKIFTYEFPDFSSSYKVTLTVRNVMGSTLSSTSLVLTTGVSAPDVSVIASFDPTLMGGKTYQFKNTSTFTGISENSLQYIWNFGDGSGEIFKNDKTFSHDFPTYSETYSVQLNVKDYSGKLLGSTIRNVTTGAVPIPGESVTADFTYTLVSGKEYRFKNTTTVTGIPESNLQYIWNFGHGSGDIIKAEKEFNQELSAFSTAHTVSLTVKKNTGEVLSVKTLDITTGPNPVSVTADFTATNAGGKSYNFTNNTVFSGIIESDLRYYWNFGDGLGEMIKIDKNFTYLFADYSHTYKVVLTVKDLLGATLGSKEISITTDPEPVNVVAAFTPTIQAGKLFRFVNDTSYSGITEADLQYVWNFGDGVGDITKTEKDFVYEFPDYSSSYTVKLIVNKVGGGKLSEVSLVVTTAVAPSPDVILTPDFTMSVSGRTVSFQNNTTFSGTVEGNLTYSWTFGDGTGAVTKPEKNFNYTYPAYSTLYRVTLTVTDTVNGASKAKSVDITTGADPVSLTADFSYSLSVGKTYDFTNSTTFSGTVEGNLTYSWQFSEGAGAIVKTEKNFTYEFPAYSATYKVTLTVTDSLSGKTSVKSVDISVGADPASATADFSYTLSGGKTYQFTNTSTFTGLPESGLEYIWNFGDGSGDIIKADKVFTYELPAYSSSYTVKLTVKRVGGAILHTVSTSITTIADPTPPPSGSITADFTYSNKNFYVYEVDFTNTSSPAAAGLQYHWDFGDGGNSVKNESSFNYTYSNPGQYNVTLTVKDPSGAIKAGPVSKIVTLGLLDKVAAGLAHSLGITPTGKLYAWGRNNDGQLGLGDWNDRNFPAEVSLPEGETVTEVSAGEYHSIALTAGGKVYVWGKNDFSQLGLPSSIASKNTPVEVTGFVGVVKSIYAGSFHNFAVISDGSVYAWGWNASSQLGLGDSTDRDTPTQITGLIGVKVVAMSAGNESSFAVTDTGDVYAWGFNGMGTLGLGIGGAGTNRTRPKLNMVLGSAKIKSISSSKVHSLVVTDTGIVYAWGSNSFEQLGVTEPGLTQATPLITNFTPSSERLSLVLARGAFSFAVSTAGKLYAWGDGSLGQLGLGGVDSKKYPEQLPFPFGGKGIKSIAAGSGHVIAVNTDGIAYSWGNNNYGQLGLGNNSSIDSPAEMKK